MFFYIFTCFFIFFFRRLAAIKHFLLYRTDAILRQFFELLHEGVNLLIRVFVPLCFIHPVAVTVA